ncbi:MAG: polysaccharide biosynthesis protein [Planctomycetota bacterium]|jgi:O-antigen/teichoic acid export membrane protein
MNTIWQRMNFLNLDRAALYAMLFRSLGIVTGPITVLVIAAAFTPELQGYYYTFIAVLSLQTLIELGLGAAIQQVASHEWARLEMDESGGIRGDEESLSRLSTVARFAIKWYASAAGIAILALGMGGYFFFAASPEHPDLAWKSPWVLLAAFTGLNLLLSPGLPILEGCNQVAQVYRFRLFQGIVIRIALWLGMLLGGGLWALVLERGLALFLCGLFYIIRFARFFSDLLRKSDLQHRFWREEIWPLQWRFAVVWISGFLPTLFIPALFAIQGPIAAGRIGMTWSITSALMSVSFAVILARMPRFAICIANREFDDLDRLFSLSLRSAVVLFLGGSIAFIGALYLLEQAGYELADRFLSILPTTLFLSAVFLQLIRFSLGTYLRAHKREPYLLLSVIEAVLTLAILYPLAKNYGATGLAFGFLIVSAILIFPACAIFKRCRTEWHA